VTEKGGNVVKISSYTHIQQSLSWDNIRPTPLSKQGCYKVL